MSTNPGNTPAPVPPHPLLSPWERFLHLASHLVVEAFQVKRVRKEADTVTLVPQDVHREPVTLPYHLAAALDIQPGQWLVKTKDGPQALEHQAFIDQHAPSGGVSAGSVPSTGIPALNLATGNPMPFMPKLRACGKSTSLVGAGPSMRCKMLVLGVTVNRNDDGTTYSESYDMTCVGGDKVQNGYPADGSDEDNDFAKWSPSGHFEISCNNPALFGQIRQGEKYYVDFTLANPAPAVIDADLQPSPTASAAALPEIPGGTIATEPPPAQPQPVDSGFDEASADEEKLRAERTRHVMDGAAREAGTLPPDPSILEVVGTTPPPTTTPTPTTTTPAPSSAFLGSGPAPETATGPIPFPAAGTSAAPATAAGDSTVAASGSAGDEAVLPAAPVAEPPPGGWPPAAPPPGSA